MFPFLWPTQKFNINNLNKYLQDLFKVTIKIALENTFINPKRYNFINNSLNYLYDWI